MLDLYDSESLAVNEENKSEYEAEWARAPNP
jgi:hypothetical protein